MALHEFRPVGPAARVLVLGASGGVGQFAIQIARRVCEAGLVAGVCSRKNAAMVKELGAHEVLPYDDGDPLEAAKAHGPFELIVDCAGSYKASRCRRLLGKGGRHVMVAGDSPGMMMSWASRPARACPRSSTRSPPARSRSRSPSGCRSPTSRPRTSAARPAGSPASSCCSPAERTRLGPEPGSEPPGRQGAPGREQPGSISWRSSRPGGFV
jgi:hypothetical protein